MPIPVKCQCGAGFAANDQLAGKTVQCPKCKNPLTIPSPAAAGVASAPAGPSIFDQAGPKGLSDGERFCPSCEARISSSAVLCVKCGYHLQTGKKLAGAKVKKAGGGDGHGASAEDALERAREAIEEEKEAKAKETEEGMPWYVLAGIFVFFTSFLCMMLWLPGDAAFLAGGTIILLTGYLSNLYFSLRMLMEVFKEGTVQGLMFLFVPFYALVYIIMRWETMGQYFVLNLLTTLVIFVGYGMILIAPYFKPSEKDKEDDARLHRPVPVLVAHVEFSPAFLSGRSYYRA